MVSLAPPTTTTSLYAALVIFCAVYKKTKENQQIQLAGTRMFVPLV